MEKVRDGMERREEGEIRGIMLYCFTQRCPDFMYAKMIDSWEALRQVTVGDNTREKL